MSSITQALEALNDSIKAEPVEMLAKWRVLELISDTLSSAAQAAAEPPYSLDADPSGIRKRAALAITGALAFGAQNVKQPPDGHWLAEFWGIGRGVRDVADKAQLDANRWRRFRSRDAYDGIDADQFINLFGADADALIDSGVPVRGATS